MLIHFSDDLGSRRITANQGLRSHVKWAGRSLLWKPLWDMVTCIWPFGCSPLSRSYFVHLACHSNRSVSGCRANAVLKSPSQNSALWVDGYVIQLEHIVVAWFLGQLAEYLAILLFLLSCYFWLKKTYPPVPSFSLFTISLKACNKYFEGTCSLFIIP